MTIKQIYDLAIKLGTQNDLRGVAAVKKKLQREKDKYDKLPADQKKEFDTEKFTNPFSDTRMFAGNPDKPVKRILAGIDIQTEELLLARELSKDKPIDLVLAHHPVGPALAGLHEVMSLQAEVLADYGVPINIAESLIRIRLQEVSRSVAPINHNRVLDAARLLGLDMMCTHTAADNMVASYLKKILKKEEKNIERVGDLIKVLKRIPEYEQAIKLKAGPMIYVGSEDRYTGRIALTEVTGGTEGSKQMYEKIAQAGIGTTLGMHLHEEYKKEAEKYHLNVVIAGHMSSDSIGMNLLMDEIEKKGVEIIPCSGFIRVKRFKKEAHKKKK
ncbi:Nif3-like dinuclear metal center hexameric protein [Patescibacteria group bacterium]|nr:Nif3-like dinuclear metal center hexameric protein [Patescibacteria group bacterium]MBU0963867.1 Nif3-like dinuclear metal center hexameric protein [Patescibacteria group bacterium]